jgi:hypothetical protein
MPLARGSAGERIDTVFQGSESRAAERVRGGRDRPRIRGNGDGCGEKRFDTTRVYSSFYASSATRITFGVPAGSVGVEILDEEITSKDCGQQQAERCHGEI